MEWMDDALGSDYIDYGDDVYTDLHQISEYEYLEGEEFNNDLI